MKGMQSTRPNSTDGRIKKKALLSYYIDTLLEKKSSPAFQKPLAGTCLQPLVRGSSGFKPEKPLKILATLKNLCHPTSRFINSPSLWPPPGQRLLREKVSPY
jgi:hypothetical protein